MIKKKARRAGLWPLNACANSPKITSVMIDLDKAAKVAAKRGRSLWVQVEGFQGFGDLSFGRTLVETDASASYNNTESHRIQGHEHYR